MGYCKYHTVYKNCFIRLECLQENEGFFGESAIGICLSPFLFQWGTIKKVILKRGTVEWKRHLNTYRK